ncbi:pelargonidin 3-O-(6-caffeoylglucoside) 5-O-(6-O-malonylglucoside) 4'''-malonyltransferase-like [Henckelia pumila]|uniref:pelargonidin 3-O-(6-caffeoylglucoside) 5-O-(6-O-malonylglucoside) 4'''-malonyltransferase-like n=1 Tax=Henckelia pumila TaxID=405737 RepID=UPI003C6DB8E2
MITKTLSRKFIKPCNPTPNNRKCYKISLLDEMSPSMNVAVILFYPKPPGNLHFLEESLRRILVKFYPLAGRYMKQNQTVDCNDEGAEFVEARADHHGLHEFIKVAADCGHLLHDLLPCDSGAVDQITDPLLSIQVTEFGCGGVSVAVCVSHRVFDASSLSTFVAALAADHAALTTNLTTRDNVAENIINPSFDSVTLWPGRNLASMDREPSRKRDPAFVTKRISFNKDAIKRLKDKMNGNGTAINRAVSRVRVVCAFLATVLTRIDRANEDEKGSRDYIVAQAVNVRGRTIPPIKKHSCGNLVAQAFVLCLGASDEARSMKFEDYVNLLGDATKKTVSDCGEIFAKGDEGGYDVIVDPKVKVVKRIKGGQVHVLWFSDWSKFGFYEVDFGWGKPVWCSVGSPAADNLVILMDNKEGDGIEACVHLHQKFMDCFEQQQEIKLLVDI